MSWAANAVNAIDATPLAATLPRGNGANAKFFPDTTTESPALSDAQREELEYAAASARSTLSSVTSSMNASRPASAKKPSVSTFIQTSSTTNTGSNDFQKDLAARAASQAALAAQPATVPAFQLEALKGEIAHLKREIARGEQRLNEKDDSLAKVSAALHKTEQDKIAEHTKLRGQIAELRKAISESESRLAFFQSDFHEKKEKEIAQIQKDNLRIVEKQNALLEAVGETIKRSATAIAPSSLVDAKLLPSASVSSLPQSQYSSATSLLEHPSFGGAGTGVTHEEHLKRVYDSFKNERLNWDKAKSAELKSVNLQHEHELNEMRTRLKKAKNQYVSQYAAWQKQHAKFTSEIDYLSEYIVKLTYLFEEIDRGRYPVAQKHGITSFVIPETRRQFLQADLEKLQLIQSSPGKKKTGAVASDVANTFVEEDAFSGVMKKKLQDLKDTFQKAGIPWDPFEIHHNQSFLIDERQLAYQQNISGHQRKLLTAPDEEQLLLKSASSSPISDNIDEEEKEATLQTIVPAQNPALESAALADTFYNEVSSHATVQYIKHVEEERDRYKYLLSLETKKKMEVHQMMTSQNRLLEGNELFKRSQQEQSNRRASVRGSPVPSNTSSTSALLSAHAQSNAQSLASVKLNHSGSQALSKSRDIIQASGTIAYNSTAGKLGINIGWNTSLAAQNIAATDGSVGLSSGNNFSGPTAASMSMLTSPSRTLLVHETHHTSGAYKNANVPPQQSTSSSSPQPRPASASPLASRESHRPISAVSVASTSYLNTHGSQASLGRMSRPASAYSSTRILGPSQNPVPAFAASPAQFPKPTPLHISHGNASATVFAVQVAKKAHADRVEQQLNPHHHHSYSATASPIEPSSNQPSSRSSHSRARTPSAGRRPHTPILQ